MRDACGPNRGDQELAALAESGSIVRFRLATGAAQVAAGTSQVFCSFVQAGLKEGLVIGCSFYTPSQDYVTNPVSIGDVGAKALQANALVPVNPVDVFSCSLGPRGQANLFGDRRGYPFATGRTPVLSVQNGSGGVLPIEGYLMLLVWDPQDRAKAVEKVSAWQRGQGAAFPERLFAGGAS